MKRTVIVLSAAVRRAPAVVLLLALALSLGIGAFATQVQEASGNEGFAPDNPELLASERIAELFGGEREEVVQILISGDGDLTSPEGVSAAIAIQEAVTTSDAATYLAEQPERPAVVTHIGPVFQAAAMAGVDPTGADGATVDQLYRDALAQMPDEQRGLVTALLPDGTDPAAAATDRALALVFLDLSELGDDFDAIAAVEADLADAVRAAELPAGVTAEPFAFPLLFADTDAFEREIGRLFGLAALIILLILAFVYLVRPRGDIGRLAAVRRTASDVALTLLVIVLAIMWVQGFAGLLGPGVLGWIGPLAEPSRILPVLLIGLGVDYAIHLTSRYREELADGVSVTDGVERATRTVGVALVLATVTTAVGFFTNLATPVPAIRDFGILAGLGIGAAFLLMLTVFPAARLLLDRRAEAAGRLPRASLQGQGERLLPALMARVAVFAERAPAVTLAITVGVGGSLGVVGLANVSTEFSFTDFVPEGSPLVATFDQIRDDFGGGFGETTEVLIEGDIATPAAHNALVAALADLATVDDVTRFGEQAAAQSPVAVLAEALQGPAAAALPQVNPDLTVPPDADVAALYDALRSAAPEPAGAVIGPDLQAIRVSIVTSAGETDAGDLAAALREVFAPVAEAVGGTAVPTSDVIISDAITTALRDSQLTSLFVAVIAAMALLVVNFWVSDRRPLLGVVTIAPVALIVLWTFGMMAATGVPVGPVTATIAALAVGIGVPYTIHVTHRFVEDRERHTSIEEAIRSTVRHTGGALAGSAFTTMAGFGILVTSSLVPFQQFGLVTVYAIGFALVAATVVLPSLLVLWDRYRRRRGDVPAAARQVTTPPPEPVGTV